MKKTTTLRLRSVKFKNGGEVRLLKPPPKDTFSQNAFEERAVAFRESSVFENLAGFVLVGWDKTGTVFITVNNTNRSGVNAGGEAQFVHDAILAHVATTWV